MQEINASTWIAIAICTTSLQALIAVLLFQLQKQNRKTHKKNNDQLTTLRADLDHHKTTQLQQLTTISETRQQLATVLQKVEQNYQLSITQHKSSLLDQQQNLRNMMQDIQLI